MVEAVRKYTGLDFDNQPLEELIAAGNKMGLDMPSDTSWGHALYNIFDAFVEEKLTGPVSSPIIPSRSVRLQRRNRQILVSQRDSSSSFAQAKAATLSASLTILSINALVSSNKCSPKQRATKRRNPTTRTSAPRSNTVCLPRADSASASTVWLCSSQTAHLLGTCFCSPQ